MLVRSALLAATLPVLFACGPAQRTPAVVPDFQLLDVNPSSPRAGTLVSPRDYVGKASGWYFVHTS